MKQFYALFLIVLLILPIDAARDFDGTDDVAEVAGAFVQDVPLTMCLWFNADALPGGSAGMMGIYSNADENGFSINLRSTGHVRARVSNDIGFAESATTVTLPANTGEWTFACGVWASSSSVAVYLYVPDETPQTVTDTDTLAINAALNRSLFGATREAGTLLDFFNGKIAEAVVWPAALTSDQVLSVSKAFDPCLVVRTGCIRIPLGGNASPELGNNGASFTLTGTTKFDHPRMFYSF